MGMTNDIERRAADGEGWAAGEADEADTESIRLQGSHWCVKHQFHNNNGLIVLQRKDQTDE